jgi:glutamine synthetase
MGTRRQVLTEITNERELRSTIDPALKGKPVTAIYGQKVFNDAAMRKYLPYKAYEAIIALIKQGGGQIDDKIAEETAHGMKEWALDHGVSHFTHWFHPMTGTTAEKHDSFLSFDDAGNPIERFSGKTLKQGEPDASSFPSGGIRSTFEARGYTAWDPTSPAFIISGVNGATLVIPTVFFSYTGEALDEKTPLLRSMDRLSDAAVKLLKHFGSKASRVWSTVGPEQEYFLVDKAYYYRRPDLVITGRTLFGAKPPKGQEMEDHYFGSIRERVLAYMQDCETELFLLGIPAKTRHNEVAPAQFEIAPIFEDSNIAGDHNQIVMDTLRKVASRHDFALLIHEKPFAGINGSGKHNNWSMSDNLGSNLLEPGKTPHQNLQFLSFLAATLKAVHKYSDLLRSTVASAGNDHRLGANEAPPAIISVFLGEQLDTILNNLEASKDAHYTDKAIINLGIAKVPQIAMDNTDRNRTSPFAFTGNKFEFRAVGSSFSILPANFTINTIVCDTVSEIEASIESLIKKGKNLNDAVMETILPIIKETKPIRFEGNNYSPEWEKEAAKRGLPNAKNTPDALKAILLPKNKEVFIKHKILSDRELESRYAIQVEKYIKTINYEANTALSMAKTLILPSVIRYQTVLANAVIALKNAGADAAAIADQVSGLNEYAKSVTVLKAEIDKLEAAIAKTNEIHDEPKKAEAFHKDVLGAMNAVRAIADHLEEETADDYWELPKYREMLFIY